RRQLRGGLLLLCEAKAERAAEGEPLDLGLALLRPAKREVRVKLSVVGEDAALPERLHPGGANALRIDAVEVLFRGEHGAQEIAEGDVHRRQIVKRADAALEKLLGRTCCLVRERDRERIAEVLACGAAGGAKNAEVACRALDVDGEEGVEDRRHQD